jgi:NitT/TauT family transport system substrate-binding protein
LRSWLASKGLRTTTEGGGDVSVVPQENALTLQTFKSGDIHGAWVPEPWASRLVLEGDGKVLVDERDLWPAGRYVTTQLIVRTEFLREHRDAVTRLVRGQVLANDFVNAHADEAKQVVAAAVAKLTGKALPAAVIDRAWSNLTFTNDPIAASLRTSAAHAVALGLLDPVDLTGTYDLGPLNAVLRARGEPQVRAA